MMLGSPQEFVEVADLRACGMGGIDDVSRLVPVIGGVGRIPFLGARTGRADSYKAICGEVIARLAHFHAYTKRLVQNNDCRCE